MPCRLDETAKKSSERSVNEIPTSFYWGANLLFFFRKLEHVNNGKNIYVHFPVFHSDAIDLAKGRITTDF